MLRFVGDSPRVLAVVLRRAPARGVWVAVHTKSHGAKCLPLGRAGCREKPIVVLFCEVWWLSMLEPAFTAPRQDNEATPVSDSQVIQNSFSSSQIMFLTFLVYKLICKGNKHPLWGGNIFFLFLVHLWRFQERYVQSPWMDFTDVED